MEATDCIYRNPSAPIEARIKDLLSRMTLREKIGQMTQIERTVATSSALKDFAIGTCLDCQSNSIFCCFCSSISLDDCCGLWLLDFQGAFSTLVVVHLSMKLCHRIGRTWLIGSNIGRFSRVLEFPLYMGVMLFMAITMFMVLPFFLTMLALEPPG